MGNECLWSERKTMVGSISKLESRNGHEVSADIAGVKAFSVENSPLMGGGPPPMSTEHRLFTLPSHPSSPRAHAGTFTCLIYCLPSL